MQVDPETTRPSPTTPPPVCIVGQYKCGTSWLLAALSAHPELVGMREIGMVQACATLLDGEVQLAPRATRTNDLFHSSAWSHNGALERALAGTEDQFRGALDRPLSITDFSPADVSEFYYRVQVATSPFRLMDRFVELAASRSDNGQRVVLKSANQLSMFDALRQWRPDVPIVVITRDGRDAAISAREYKLLMQHKPWFGGHKSYQDLLRDWLQTAAVVRRRHMAGELHLIRYEDLTVDFEATMAGLLRSLEVDSSPPVIEQIRRFTDFEAVTGRPRGSEGVGVVRKGAIGEWQTVLSARQKRAAWKLAGSVLGKLGYSASGRLEPLPSPSVPTAS